MVELWDGRVTDYLHPHERRDKTQEEKEGFKFHGKADWKFPQETKRREAFKRGGPLCTRHGEHLTVLLRKCKESGMITAPGAGEEADRGRAAGPSPHHGAWPSSWEQVKAGRVLTT